MKRLAPAGAIEPDCSPSKARIVFVQFVDRRDENGTYLATERLRVMDLRSGSARILRASRHPVSQEWRAFQEPTISPNGRYVAFNTHATDPGTSYSILAAGGRHLWTSPSTDMPAHCSWSPDSRGLLWTQADLTPISTVLMHSVVTGKDRQIGSPQAVQITAYDWSPDGHWLLYDGYAGSDASQTIWVIGVDGSGLRALADGWNADWGR